MKKLSFHPCGNYRETYAEELAIFDTWFGRISLIVFLVLLFGLAPLFASPYLLYVLNNIGIMAIAAIGLNILIGISGQISLGHGAFFGVGAYAGRFWPRGSICLFRLHSRGRVIYRHGRHDFSAFPPVGSRGFT
jgi:branched-chain amino acid transport system permease protein